MDSPNPVTVTIAIPTRNRAESLAACLDSLILQSYSNFDVIVADGGSTDGTKSLLEQYSKKLSIRLVSASGGLVAQMNTALECAKGQIFVRIDDDVSATPEWLASVVESFESSNRVGGVTGPTLIPLDRMQSRDLFRFQTMFLKGKLFWRVVGAVYYQYFMEGTPFDIGKWFKSGAFSLGSNFVGSTKLATSMQVSHHEACNMAVRRDLLTKIGGFDKRYVGIGEYHEPDASFKIRRLGYAIIFNPHAIVYHLPSTEGFFRNRPDAYWRAANFVNFYMRNIRINEFGKAVRFLTYLLFLNSYWTFIYLATKNRGQLDALRGTLNSILNNTLSGTKD